jgi:hypothetical protein
MPLSPEEFFENATSQGNESDNDIPSIFATWETFPFDADGLAVVPLRRPLVPEAPRNGEDPLDCRGCTANDGLIVWENENWRLKALSEPSGVPLVMILGPKQHCDYGELSDELAAEFGQILVHTVRAVESLEHIARAHVLRWGDGSAHMHVFISARPEGFVQLRGTFLAVWDDLLPPVPREMRDADAMRVGGLLAASLGSPSAP